MTNKDVSSECEDSTTLSNVQSEDKLEIALHKATREQLCDIIRKRSERDKTFYNEALMRLGTPDSKEAMSAAKERVRLAIRQNTSRGFIGERGCDAICDEIFDCLDATKSLYFVKYPEITFEIVLYLLISGVKLASTADSSSGSLSSVIDEAMELLEDTCKEISESGNSKLQTHCYDKLCKEALNKAFDGWEEWSYDILKISALLTTQKNHQKLNEVLKQLRSHNEQRTYPSSYVDIAEAKVRLRMTETLNGKAAARAFINTHLDMDEIRMLAVQQDMETGVYQNAERLCIERICSPNKSYYDNKEWMHLLFEIYEATGETQKQIDIADKLIFHGETQYYDKMKALYGSEWKSVYPAIRARYKTSSVYMYVLNVEHEWLLLLNEVRKQPSAVFQYGKALAEYAPDVVYDIYEAEIVGAAADAADRHAYKRVCASIRELNVAGGTEKAMELIDELSETYKRRPAMLDELATLRRKLKK